MKQKSDRPGYNSARGQKYVEVIQRRLEWLRHKAALNDVTSYHKQEIVALEWLLEIAKESEGCK